jgi:O-antigen ligase
VVTFILGILFIAIFLGFLRSTLLAFPVIIFFVISIPLMIQIAPEVWRITLLRFSFIENISSGVSLEDIELARAGSIYNSINTLSENKSFLTGMGYGSWFSDAYFPMPNLTISGFDEDSLNTGKYYRVHDFSFHFLFKFGIIGIFLYADSFLKPIISIWKKRLHYRADIFSRRISILFLGTFPMALTFMWFTGKGLMFCAFFIVLAYEWIKYFDNKFNYN